MTGWGPEKTSDKLLALGLFIIASPILLGYKLYQKGKEKLSDVKYCIKEKLKGEKE